MTAALITVVQDGPWLEARLPARFRVRSWAPHRPGVVETDRIVWREVRNADLPAGFDAEGWLAAACAETGRAGTVAMITSRDLAARDLRVVGAGAVQAACLATVGLSNAERVGHRRPAPPRGWGTVNLAVAVDVPLTEAAHLEAMALAASARTAAVMEEAGLDLPGGRATGTGTDCLALACPLAGAAPAAYAGMHTALGEAIGGAVYQAVAAGARRWLREVAGPEEGRGHG